jgi:hypothetical protein
MYSNVHQSLIYWLHTNHWYTDIYTNIYIYIGICSDVLIHGYIWLFFKPWISVLLDALVYSWWENGRETGPEFPWISHWWFFDHFCVPTRWLRSFFGPGISYWWLWKIPNVKFGQSTISIRAMFNNYVANYQRVVLMIPIIPIIYRWFSTIIIHYSNQLSRLFFMAQMGSIFFVWMIHYIFLG